MNPWFKCETSGSGACLFLWMELGIIMHINLITCSASNFWQSSYCNLSICVLQEDNNGSLLDMHLSLLKTWNWIKVEIGIDKMK